MSRGFRLFLILELALVGLDQVTKAWARAAASGVEGRVFLPVWPNVFELKLVYNRGVAFGMAEGFGLWLAPLAVAIGIGAAIHSYRSADEGAWTHVTMAALAAGALGNVIDRLTLGHVVDLFYVRLIDFPVFNVADVCITFAGAVFVYLLFADLLKNHKEKVAESEAGSP